MKNSPCRHRRAQTSRFHLYNIPEQATLSTVGHVRIAVAFGSTGVAGNRGSERIFWAAANVLSLGLDAGYSGFSFCGN